MAKVILFEYRKHSIAEFIEGGADATASITISIEPGETTTEAITSVLGKLTALGLAETAGT